MQKIPAFDAHGNSMRPYSLEAVERLYKQRKIWVKYSRKGRITAAMFLPHDRTPVLKTAHMGQRYSFPDRCGDHKAWKHADLLSPNSIEKLAGLPLVRKDIELHLQSIFRAVPLSCMAGRRSPEPPAAPARVLKIERKRKPAQAVAELPVAA